MILKNFIGLKNSTHLVLKRIFQNNSKKIRKSVCKKNLLLVTNFRVSRMQKICHSLFIQINSNSV